MNAVLTSACKQLNVTIVTMQRTFTLLQAEFVVICEKKIDEVIEQTVSGVIAATQKSKRLRIGNVA